MLQVIPLPELLYWPDENYRRYTPFQGDALLRPSSRRLTACEYFLNFRPSKNVRLPYRGCNAFWITRLPFFLLIMPVFDTFGASTVKIDGNHAFIMIHLIFTEGYPENSASTLISGIISDDSLLFAGLFMQHWGYARRGLWVSPLLWIGSIADYKGHSSKQFCSRVLQMDAPSSCSMHSTYSNTHRLSHP